MNFERTPEYIHQLKGAIADENIRFVSDRMQELLPQDISQILPELDKEEGTYIFNLLDDKRRAQVVRELNEDFRVEFLADFSADEIAGFIHLIESDDAADILKEQDQEDTDEIIEIIEDKDKAKADDLKDLLNYDEDSAGGLMQKELIRANLNWSVLQCVEEMREQAKKVGKIYSVYVVDNQHKLLGRVSVKRMLLAEDHTLISELYDSEVISVDVFMKANEVADLMKKYDLVAVPVVNLQGKLLGRITIDDVVDVITEKAEIDMQLMSGIASPTVEEDSIWHLTKSRLPWLVVGMLGGMLAAYFMDSFENFIAHVPAMAFFIPLITATGGNVGIQSSSLVVQSLARDANSNFFTYERMGKGLLVAIINGLAIGLIVFIINYLLVDNLRLGIVVSIALFTVVMLSSFMGTVTPLILNRFGINPAVASGPFITTTNDLIGIAVYFLLASSLYESSLL